ncbi:MAG: isopentenyl-diphosphate Delta-isomerase [Micromonosporaceae bacterium]|nr:isopentenyl-diphosphate Delta-isomerase [Micromonosporaceae bacterium]
MSRSDHREDLLVVTVDERGAAVGTCTVAEAHTGFGVRHRAFSVLLRDSEGRVLLQRRAEAKTRYFGVWANTCCGHPAPGEAVVAAAARRLTEEMGLRGVRLTEVGAFVYHAVDAATSRAEYEFDHVLVGQSDDDPTPDPLEVADWCRSDLSLLLGCPEQAADGEGQYAPWLGPVMRLSYEYWYR